jgi:hypothetical protein
VAPELRPEARVQRFQLKDPLSMIRRSVLSFLAVLLTTASVEAQTAPEPVRLSVLFADEVEEEQARSFLRNAGLTAVEYRFAPTLLHGTCSDEISEKEMAALMALPAVKDVYVQDLARLSDEAPEDAAVTRSGMRYHYTIEFSPETREEQAREAVGVLDHFHVRRFMPRTREAVIVVSPADEEEIVVALEESPLVRYVVFLATVD